MRQLALLLSLIAASFGVFFLGSLPASAAEGPVMPDEGAVNLEFDTEDLEIDRSVEKVPTAVPLAAAAVVLFIGLAITILLIAAWWKVFAKAGKPGWAAIIPIYNLVVLLEICGRPVWWILLLLIPCVQSPVFALIVMIDLAKSFGKGVLFGIGLLLLGVVFMPILGFGNAQYVGPAAAQ